MTLERDRTSQVGLRTEHQQPWPGRSQSTPTAERSCILLRIRAKTSATLDIEWYRVVCKVGKVRTFFEECCHNADIAYQRADKKISRNVAWNLETLLC